MNIFPHFNESTKCLICGKNNDGQGVLIPIDGTVEGNIERVMQVHLDCINLRVSPEGSKLRIIYQQFQEEKCSSLPD